MKCAVSTTYFPYPIFKRKDIAKKVDILVIIEWQWYQDVRCDLESWNMMS